MTTTIQFRGQQVSGGSDFLKNIFLNMVLGKPRKDFEEALKLLDDAFEDKKIKVTYAALQVIATRR